MYYQDRLTENVKLLQKAVLISQHRFLIMRRAVNSPSRPNKWDLPGGNAEWINSSVDVNNPHRLDLIREIKEETGVKIGKKQIDDQAVCFAGTYFRVSSHPAQAEAMPQPQIKTQRADRVRRGENAQIDSTKNSSEIYSVILGWKIVLPKEFDKNSIQLSHEHTAFRWVKLTEFDDYDFGFAGEKDGFIRRMVDNAFRSSR